MLTIHTSKCNTMITAVLSSLFFGFIIQEAGLPVIRQPSLATNSECRIHFGGPIHVTVLNHNINATNVANLLGWVSVHQDHAGVLAQRYRTKIMVHVQANGLVQRLSLPGGHLEDGASSGGESRAPCRGVVPASRLYCHESEPAEPGGRAVLQQTEYSGAMDQGGQAGSHIGCGCPVIA